MPMISLLDLGIHLHTCILLSGIEDSQRQRNRVVALLLAMDNCIAFYG
jgi:hypothetical protein